MPGPLIPSDKITIARRKVEASMDELFAQAKKNPSLIIDVSTGKSTRRCAVKAERDYEEFWHFVSAKYGDDLGLFARCRTFAMLVNHCTKGDYAIEHEKLKSLVLVELRRFPKTSLRKRVKKRFEDTLSSVQASVSSRVLTILVALLVAALASAINSYFGGGSRSLPESPPKPEPSTSTYKRQDGQHNTNLNGPKPGSALKPSLKTHPGGDPFGTGRADGRLGFAVELVGPPESEFASVNPSKGSSAVGTFRVEKRSLYVKPSGASPGTFDVVATGTTRNVMNLGVEHRYVPGELSKSYGGTYSTPTYDLRNPCFLIRGQIVAGHPFDIAFPGFKLSVRWGNDLIATTRSTGNETRISPLWPANFLLASKGEEIVLLVGQEKSDAEQDASNIIVGFMKDGVPYLLGRVNIQVGVQKGAFAFSGKGLVVAGVAVSTLPSALYNGTAKWVNDETLVELFKP